MKLIVLCLILMISRVLSYRIVNASLRSPLSMMSSFSKGINDIGNDIGNDVIKSVENNNDTCNDNNNNEILLKTWLEKIETSIAKSRKVKGGNYVQIATIDENGSPNCRTVVFRGFLKYNNDENIAMKMITDLRSEKVNQIKSSPICEMVWWFSQSSEQYRIKGTLKLVSNESNELEEFKSARKQMWGNLSDPAREQFFWLQPGKEYEGNPIVPIGGRDSDGKVLSPPDTFLLMLLLPSSVKYLRLKDNYAQNDRLENNNTWLSTRVNP